MYFETCTQIIINSPLKICYYEHFIWNFQATEATVKQQNVQSGNSPISTPAKQNQRREASGRLIRSILLNNESRQSLSTTGAQHKIQILSSEFRT